MTRHIETKMSMSSKFYVRNQLVDCEEDFTHEFKGHKNICREDLPPWTQEKGNTDKASRRAVSRNLNAFLNTGKGGTVYLGVIDSGHVKGLQLSQYQKEHIIGSVRDVMSRYNPPVKRHRYKGILLQDYVIEISIRPWDPADPLNAEEGCGQLANIHPIHDDEEGNCYFRRQASIVKVPAPSVHTTRRKRRRHRSYSRPDRKEPAMKPIDHVVKMAAADSKSADTSKLVSTFIKRFTNDSLGDQNIPHVKVPG
ncbi:hypothetical protein MAR_027113 [Mya arenaria]|uniref:Schlafen AlbA-2 domain-containing protein n=1 Tax=Mya arenaria TaxID=6604 RepID=A0ABY7ESI0_MYAAR|nr:hypothetical protein MAR_027113 [Mya arenaria]